MRVDGGRAQRVLVTVQPAAGHPAPERAGDRPDAGVPERDQVLGGDPAGVPVVGPDERHAAARHCLQAHRGHVLAQQVGDRAVLLDLGRGDQDAVDPPLDERAHDVRAVRAAGREVADEDRVPVAARLLFGSDGGLRDRDIGRVARDQADRRGAALDEGAGDRVRPVSEFAGGGEYPLLGFRRDTHVAAVQHLARGLEGDARPRGDLLDRHVLPSRHVSRPRSRPRCFVSERSRTP